MMDTDNPMPASPRAPLGLMIVGAAFLFVVLFGGGYLTIRDGMTSSRPAPGGMEEQDWPPDSQADDDLSKWQKPLVAIVVSGQMHGYTDPCGCSIPQYGGLTRRYNFIQSLKEKKWDVVGIDLGELPSLKGVHLQNLLKYEMTVRSLAAMNYKVIGIGRDEIVFPLGDALAQIADVRYPFPRPINVSLAEAAPGQKFYEGFNLRQYEIINTNPKIGVINVIGPDLRKEMQSRGEKFLEGNAKALDEFANKGVEIGIVLHHEYPKLDETNFPIGGFKRLKEIEKIREEQAKTIADLCAEQRAKYRKVPPIQLMMMLSDEEEAPSFMKQINKTTQAIEIGHKGKYVGLVGIYRDKQGYRVQYQKVLMSPDWDTKEGKEKDNPVTKWMEKYNKELERQNVLAMAPRSPHYNQNPADPQKPGLKATYVGSNRCKNCHPDAFKVWAATKHSHATDKLESLKFPSGRQHDPECMKCHTTGFEHPGGYNDLVANLAQWTPNQKQNVAPVAFQAHNQKLRGVGCESCHGPASEHVKVAGDRKLTPDEIKRINPYRPTDEERKLEGVVNKNAIQKNRFDDLLGRRMDALSLLCMKCHDSENDVHFLSVGVTGRWFGGKDPVVHRTPGPNKNNNGDGKGPGAKKDEPPPIVIEIFEDKKK